MWRRSGLLHAKAHIDPQCYENTLMIDNQAYAYRIRCYWHLHQISLFFCFFSYNDETPPQILMTGAGIGEGPYLPLPTRLLDLSHCEPKCKCIYYAAGCIWCCLFELCHVWTDPLNWNVKWKGGRFMHMKVQGKDTLCLSFNLCSQSVCN